MAKPSVNDVARWQALAQTKAQEAARAEGAYNEVMGAIKRDYKAGTLKEAKVLLTRLEAEAAAAEAAYEQAIRQFEAGHGEELIR
jgi:hypothetical protein